MNKKQAPSHVMASSVSRQGELTRIRAAEQAQQQAHNAALHVIDVIENLAGPPPDIRGPLSGPRTGTHPMATPLESLTRGPQPPAGIDHPIILSVSHSSSWMAPLMLSMASLLAGIAIGRMW